VRPPPALYELSKKSDADCGKRECGDADLKAEQADQSSCGGGADVGSEYHSRDCFNVRSPALQKLTIMTVVALEDWTAQVTKNPARVPLNRFEVARLIMGLQSFSGGLH
jgi:hypothetical protein